MCHFMEMKVLPAHPSEHKSTLYWNRAKHFSSYNLERVKNLNQSHALLFLFHQNSFACIMVS